MTPLVTGRHGAGAALRDVCNISYREQTACDHERLNWDAVIQILAFPISGSVSRPRFCHSLSWRRRCRATTATKASSRVPGCTEEACPWGWASAMKEEPARGRGWKYSKEQQSLCRSWGISCFSSKKKCLGLHEGAAPSPLAPLPLHLPLLCVSQQLSPQPVISSSSSHCSVKWLW